MTRLSLKTKMDDYSRVLFEQHLGQIFEFDPLRNARDRAQLELLEVSGPSGGKAIVGFREPFTLLFALRSSEDLAMGLHRLVHQDFEACDWFLNRVVVPDRDPQQAYYQAVFG
jgi:hypothetical protein